MKITRMLERKENMKKTRGHQQQENMSGASRKDKAQSTPAMHIKYSWKCKNAPAVVIRMGKYIEIKYSMWASVYLYILKWMQKSGNQP